MPGFSFFRVVIIGFTVAMSSMLFFLGWNTIGHGLWGLPELDYLPILAVFLLYAPIQAMIKDTVFCAYFKKAPSHRGAKK